MRLMILHMFHLMGWPDVALINLLVVGHTAIDHQDLFILSKIESKFNRVYLILSKCS